MRTRAVVLTLLLAAVIAAPPVAPAQTPAPASTPTARGSGGAVATVDPYASQAAIDVLRRGGNAVDAAVAAAAVLGVVEPYSCGIGGGGFMVIRLPNGRETTIDSREAAPGAFQPTAFQEDGRIIPFDERVTSGLGVGVPGTVRGWEMALERYGTRSMRRTLAPAIRLAEAGFVVDSTFTTQTDANKARFEDFPETAKLFVPGGVSPQPGTTLDNDDLGATYRQIAKNGADAFYGGAIAEDIVRAVKQPPVRPGTRRRVRPGVMELSDLTAYRALRRAPTRSSYRSFEVIGMGPPSSGGTTIGEALNIIEGFTPADRTTTLHRFLEASRFSFADRGAFLGDPAHVKVPVRGLLSDAFAAERRALITDRAQPGSVAAGDPSKHQGGARSMASAAGSAQEGPSTTHLTVADRDGMVVSYTFTIEQTGGSGITVPGRGFLLNNELTDFEPQTGLPNSPAAFKRPRSSMSPTIVLRGDRPVLALGSPGGATIITSVLQVLVERFERRNTLPNAIAAPRASQRNAATTQAEPAFIASPEGQALRQRGHAFAETPEIGAVAAIELRGRRRLRMLAAAEPTRRGGGSAMVVRPALR